MTSMVRKFRSSEALSARLSEIVPGGVNSNIRLKPPSIVFARGRGAWLWDVDQNDYVDYVLGQGPNFLGHANPEIHAAVSAATQDGMVYGGTSSHELAAAESVLSGLGWPEAIRLGMTGTEVDQVALRLARSVTGRQRFIKFQGHYHGWMDDVLVSRVDGKNVALSSGQMTSHLDDSEILPWNDAGALEQALSARPDEYAAVIMEPVMLNHGAIEPVPRYLASVRDLCTRYGVVLIFDEVITGFRIDRQGAYGRYGVQPDLATYGKAIAGGWPAAALVGPMHMMKGFGTGEVTHAGTFNASVMSCAAITATQNILGTSCSYERINAYGETLRTRLEEIADKYGAPLRTQGVGAAFHASFGPRGVVSSYEAVTGFELARYARFREYLATNGIWTTARGTWYISMAHGDREMDVTLSRFEKALQEFLAAENKA